MLVLVEMQILEFSQMRDFLSVEISKSNNSNAKL